MSKIVPLLVARTGLRERDIRIIIATAPGRYKTYPIAKRSGGQRWISQPARELKMLQRVLLSEILIGYSAHSAASAYVNGKSIRHNAEAHLGSGPILKMDFKDFFPSLKAKDWHLFCAENTVFEDTDDIDISTNILFHRKKSSSVLRLAIGAPTSPHLSNLLLREFDCKISDMLMDTKVIYSRYADDITFSAPRTGHLQGIESDTKKILRAMKSPSLHINDDKTVFATNKYKRMVTGLILSNDGRVTVGRRRKHLLRAALHQASLGLLDDRELARLSGMLAFLNDVEPMAFAAVRAKHGDALINLIKSKAKQTP